MKLFKVKVASLRFREDVVVAESLEDARRWIDQDAMFESDFDISGDWDYDGSPFKAEEIEEIVRPEDIPQCYRNAIPWGDEELSQNMDCEMILSD